MEGFCFLVTVLFFWWFAKVVGGFLLLRYILCCWFLFVFSFFWRALLGFRFGFFDWDCLLDSSCPFLDVWSGAASRRLYTTPLCRLYVCFKLCLFIFIIWCFVFRGGFLFFIHCFVLWWFAKVVGGCLLLRYILCCWFLFVFSFFLACPARFPFWVCRLGLLDGFVVSFPWCLVGCCFSSTIYNPSL